MSSSSAARNRPSAAAWNHRTDPLRQGDDPGGGAGTGDAQVDRASGARAGLEMRGAQGRAPRRSRSRRPGADPAPSTCRSRPGRAPSSRSTQELLSRSSRRSRHAFPSFRVRPVSHLTNPQVERCALEVSRRPRRRRDFDSLARPGEPLSSVRPEPRIWSEDRATNSAAVS